MKAFSFLAIIGFTFVATLDQAKTFSNQFIEFQLPEICECQLDVT